MISTLDPNSQGFLTGLNRIGERMSRAQRQIAAGVRVAQVSDDPDHIATLLSARAHLESARQIKQNLGRVKAEVDSSEEALRGAVRLFERARTLGAQGANSTNTPETRFALIQELGSVLEQMVGLTSTSVEGRYVFAGDTDQTIPYTVDLSLASPISAYLGAPATRRVQHPNGSTVRVAHNAQEIFASTDPTKNVFQAVLALYNGLTAGDTAAIQTALGNMPAVGVHLNGQLAFYGTIQNKLAEAQDFGEQLQVALQSQISTLEDTDLTAAILELNQGEVQQQAALNAWARIPRTTLFDYLG